MPTERIVFQGAFGDRLAARVETPSQPRAWALFAHCFTCSKDLKSIRRMSEALAARGIGVLRFDFTGLGESEGDFARTSFSSNLDDLLQAADHLRRSYGPPRILIGHSLGGAAVLAVAADVPECRAVVTIAAPSDPSHLLRRVLPPEEEMPEEGETEVEIAGRSFRVRRQLLRDLEQHSLSDRIGELDRALLILHSPQDTVVNVDHARKIFEAARHPKSFVAIDGADHLLLDQESDARFAAQMIATWAARYVDGLGEEAERRTEEEPEPPENDVRVRSVSGLAQDIRIGRHRLRADEPIAVGGSGSGPTPYQLLLAGLGACISMTLELYAKRKEWPLEGVEVRLRHSKIHAEDCRDCETKEGKIDRIEKELRMAGPLDDEQRERLHEISRRCPVHRTLDSEVSIVEAPVTDGD